MRFLVILILSTVLLVLITGGIFLVNAISAQLRQPETNVTSSPTPSDGAMSLRDTASAATALIATEQAVAVYTPTRTRPPRTFFVRPTLAESTPSPELLPSSTPTLTPGTTQQQPTQPTEPATQTEPAATFTPTSTYIAPTPSGQISTEPSLRYIKMTDRASGWGFTYNAVLRTTNGGVTWVDTTPIGLDIGNDTMYGVFLNTNEGWIFLFDDDDETGLFYRTKDGGNSWHAGPTPFAEANVFFLDAQRGWALAYRSTISDSQAIDIFTTSDGGSSWDKIHEVTALDTASIDQIPYKGIKTGISFKDSQRGWVTGIDLNSNQAWLYTSDDGGLTWVPQPLALPTGPQTKTVITETLEFFSPRDGLLILRLTQISDFSVIYTTSDGGKSWTFTTPVPITGPVSCPTFDSCRIWDGIILASTDNSGSTWNQLVPNTDLSRTLLQMDFPDLSYGYALSLVGSGPNAISTLFFSGDGGKTWTPLW